MYTNSPWTNHNWRRKRRCSLVHWIRSSWLVDQAVLTSSVWFERLYPRNWSDRLSQLWTGFRGPDGMLYCLPVNSHHMIWYTSNTCNNGYTISRHCTCNNGLIKYLDIVFNNGYTISQHRILVMGCREQPPRGAPWVSGLVVHFVQTWPDSECSHTVQCLDGSDLNWRCNRYHLFWRGVTLLVLMCH